MDGGGDVVTFIPSASATIERLSQWGWEDGQEVLLKSEDGVCRVLGFQPERLQRQLVSFTIGGYGRAVGEEVLCCFHRALAPSACRLVNMSWSTWIGADVKSFTATPLGVGCLDVAEEVGAGGKV